MRKHLLLLFGLMAAGCTKTVYVPVDNTRVEYQQILSRDSIHIHDSVYIYGKNDTVWLERYKTIYRDRILIDSVFRQDTIRVPYPVEKILYQNRTNRLQQILIYAGILFFILLFFKWIK